MISQIVSVLMSYLLGRQSPDAPGFFPNLTLASLRKLMMIMAGVMASLALFIGGAFTVLMDLILSSRDHGQLMLSPASMIGFLLMGFSILALAGLFSRKLWRRTREMAPSREEALAKAIAPVTDAVAGLIRDFAEERKQAVAAAAAYQEAMMQEHQAQMQAQAAQQSSMPPMPEVPQHPPRAPAFN